MKKPRIGTKLLFKNESGYSCVGFSKDEGIMLMKCPDGNVQHIIWKFSEKEFNKFLKLEK